MYPSAFVIKQWAVTVALPYWPPILSSATVSGLFLPVILTNYISLPGGGGGTSCSPHDHSKNKDNHRDKGLLELQGTYSNAI